MREIKFRAYLWTDRHTNDGMIYSDEMGMIEFWKNYLHYQGKKKLMQYTGLKDKNDREIYEGDIIEYKGLFGRKRIGVVKYIEEEALFAIVENYTKDTLWSLDLSCAENIEVIGNVYENPELLKEAEND